MNYLRVFDHFVGLVLKGLNKSMQKVCATYHTEIFKIRKYKRKVHDDDK